MDYELLLDLVWNVSIYACNCTDSENQVYVNGATRWINLGFTNFQPSELAKILLIIFFAKFIMKHKEDLSEKQTILKAVVLIAIPLALILKEPNLSTTICTATLFCFLMYVGGLSYRFIGTVLLITIPVAVIFLSIVVQPNQKLLDNYQQKRILCLAGAGKIRK